MDLETEAILRKIHILPSLERTSGEKNIFLGPRQQVFKARDCLLLPSVCVAKLLHKIYSLFRESSRGHT